MPDFFDIRNPLSGSLGNSFVSTDVDESSNPRYYGYLNEKGRWIISQVNTSTGAIRYAQGKSGYSTNWTGRAGLTYVYYNLINEKYS